MQSTEMSESAESLLLEFFDSTGDSDTTESYELACAYYGAGEVTFSEFCREFNINTDYALDTETMYNLAENVIKTRGSGILVGVTETTVVYCSFF